MEWKGGFLMKRKSRIVFFLMSVIAALSSLKVSAFMPRVVAVVAEEPEKYNLYLMDLDGKNRKDPCGGILSS